MEETVDALVDAVEVKLNKLIGLELTLEDIDEIRDVLDMILEKYIEVDDD